jgi:hypothetical protein
MKVLIAVLCLSASPAFSAAVSGPDDVLYVEHLPACYAKSESSTVYQSSRRNGYEWGYSWYFEPWVQMNLCFYYSGSMARGLYKLCSERWTDVCAVIPLPMSHGEAFGILIPQE